MSFLGTARLKVLTSFSFPALALTVQPWVLACHPPFPPPGGALGAMVLYLQLLAWSSGASASWADFPLMPTSGR